jgi:uracil-DNA glycosylase
MVKLMLLIVGHSPSKQDPDGVLDNCQSGRRLNEWLEAIGASRFYEIEKVNAFTLEEAQNLPSSRKAARRLRKRIKTADAVIALGKGASTVVSLVRGDYISLPHPSGLNRQLNDKTFVLQKLWDAKEELEFQYRMRRPDAGKVS